MKKEKIQEHIESRIVKDDALVGYFLAIQPFKFWLFLLIGPFAILSMKCFYVAVTKNNIMLHSLNMFGKFSGSESFKFKEIESVKISKGILQRPIVFKFTNGRRLKLKAQLKGRSNVAKITEPVQQYIEENIKTIR
ncbi:PH domain-containing protein [Iodobacter sp. LRB]|uniref:PH domain-containing protein n=1 Tax=unclassified Iodobacter TaxID=235634 RepID=UPI000C0DE176|nr:PH domain-containing protein [Iodobacter sp. BJB302]PHU99832.1 hypothetical protein CSQ88_20410 [Iodobacter sp. BJB302]